MLTLDRQQRAVPTIDVQFYSQTKNRLNDPQRRDQQHNDRHKRDQDAIYQAGHPEWQPTIKEALSRSIVTGCFGADRIIVLKSGREFAFALQKAGGAMNFLRRFK